MSESSQPESHPEIARLLKSVFLFREWPDGDLLALARFTRVVEFDRGRTLFARETRCDHLHVLLSGRVHMTRLTPDGREILLHVISPVGLVGCAALFMGRSYPANAAVVSHRAKLLRIRGEPLLKLLETRSDLSRQMIGALAGRLGELANRIESRASESARHRLVDWILDQPVQRGDRKEQAIRLETSKKAVAEDLGMTPETFSRLLRALVEQGLITVDQRVIRIRDVQGLAAQLERE